MGKTMLWWVGALVGTFWLAQKWTAAKPKLDTRAVTPENDYRKLEAPQAAQEAAQEDDGEEIALEGHPKGSDAPTGRPARPEPAKAAVNPFREPKRGSFDDHPEAADSFLEGQLGEEPDDDGDGEEEEADVDGDVEID